MTQGPNKTHGGDFMVPFSYKAHTAEFEPIDERTLGFEPNAFGIETSGVFKRPVTTEEVENALQAVDNLSRVRRSESPAFRARQIERLKKSEAYLAASLDVYGVRSDEVPEDLFNILVDGVTDRRRRLLREDLVDVARVYGRIERCRAERMNVDSEKDVLDAIQRLDNVELAVMDRMEGALLEDLKSAMGMNGQRVNEIPKNLFVETVVSSIARTLGKNIAGGGPQCPAGNGRFFDTAMSAMHANTIGRFRVMIGEAAPPLVTSLWRPVPILK